MCMGRLDLTNDEKVIKNITFVLVMPTQIQGFIGDFLHNFMASWNSILDFLYDLLLDIDRKMSCKD